MSSCDLNVGLAEAPSNIIVLLLNLDHHILVLFYRIVTANYYSFSVTNIASSRYSL